jgi:hypothetical protein
LTYLRKPWEFEEPACAEVGTSLFFSKDHDDPGQAAIEEDPYKYGKQVCAKCTHVVECAEWGIENEKHGLWGGLTPKERNLVKRKRILMGNTISIRSYNG